MIVFPPLFGEPIQVSDQVTAMVHPRTSALSRFDIMVQADVVSARAIDDCVIKPIVAATTKRTGFSVGWNPQIDFVRFDGHFWISVNCRYDEGKHTS